MDDFIKRVGVTIENEYTRLEGLISHEDQARKLKACAYVKHRDCYQGTKVVPVKLYSGIPKNYFENISKGLVEYLTPKSGGWFRLLPPIARSLDPSMVAENNAELKALEAMTNFVDAVIIDSNYHSEMLKSIKDWFCSGTGHLSKDKNKDRSGKISFRNEDPQQVVFDVDQFGLVNCYIKKFFLTERECVRLFGYETVRDEKQRKDNPDSKLTLYEIVCDKTQYLYDTKENEYFDFSDRIGKYVHFVWCTERGKMFANDSFREMPMYTFRRDVDNSDCLCGHGIIEDNLEDIIIFNDMMNLRQIGFQKNANPPMAAPMALYGKMDVRPYAVNYVPDMSQRPVPLLNGMNYSQMLNDIQDMKESLKESLGVNIFVPVINSNDSRKTAYEVSELKNDSMVLMAQSIGDIKRELLEPMIKDILKDYYKEYAEENIPNFEPYIDSLRVELNSIFVQRLNAYFKRNALTQVITTTVQIGSVYSGVYDVVDFEKMFRLYCVSEGLSSSLIRSPEEIQAIKEQQQQMAMMQMQAQVNKDNAAAMNSMAQAQQQEETLA